MTSQDLAYHDNLLVTREVLGLVCIGPFSCIIAFLLHGALPFVRPRIGTRGSLLSRTHALFWCEAQHACVFHRV
jgi:hypothetical protein